MIIFSIIFLILIILYFLGAFIIYRMAFYSPIKNQNDFYRVTETEPYLVHKERTLTYVKNLLDLKYEEVSITNTDGLKLFGRYYHVKDNAPVDICCHGWRSNGVKDFCAGATLCFKLNHNVLIIDERSQGISQGHTITFGIKEKFDILEWINYVVNRFGKAVEINLIGISMGAATVLMTTGLNLPSNIKHILADCPYSSPIAIIKKVCAQDMHLPYKLLRPLILSAAAIFGHFNILDKNSNAAHAVKNTTIPILIIHGDADGFVPCYMSKEIADANPNIKREIFAGADHGLSFMIDTPRYEKLVSDFLNH